jgi:virginiamycin B lyase
VLLVAAGCVPGPDTPPPSTVTTDSEAGTDVLTTSTAGPATTNTVSGATSTPALPSPPNPELLGLEAFPVPPGSRPHDVAPAADGGVWYTAQGSGELGWLDPTTGATRHFDLGVGARPHGVIVDEVGAPWITDSGLNAIVRFNPTTQDVTVFPLPLDRSDTNLNTATFDGSGILWFTGQSGIIGRLDPKTGVITVFDAPEGRGPYGITTTPTGSVYYSSLAGSYIGKIEADGSVVVLEPPTPDQGARRVWSASDGAVWVSEWNSGNVSRYQPASGEWTTWPLPGEHPQTYAIYVDDFDVVWLSDFGTNSILRFDPRTERFSAFPLPHDPGEVRQLHGRPGEVWGAESAADHLVVIRASS